MELSDVYVNDAGRLCKIISGTEYEITGVMDNGFWKLKRFNPR